MCMCYSWLSDRLVLYFRDGDELWWWYVYAGWFIVSYFWWLEIPEKKAKSKTSGIFVVSVDQYV